MRNGLPRSYDAWRTAGPPEPRDDLPPGYEHNDISQDGEAQCCFGCTERVDLVTTGVLLRGARWLFFCTPECAWDDYTDRQAGV